MAVLEVGKTCVSGNVFSVMIFVSSDIHNVYLLIQKFSYTFKVVIIVLRMKSFWIILFLKKYS